MRAALEAEKAAQQKRETALVRERAALRRGQCALAAAAVLFVCVIGVGALGSSGFLDPSYLNIQTRKFRDILLPTVLTAEQERALKPADRFQECASCPEMVVVPAGGFMMGSADGNYDETPVHKVTIGKPLAAGKIRVTFDEWDGCVAHGRVRIALPTRAWEGVTGRFT